MIFASARQPAVAGSFYPEDAAQLRTAIAEATANASPIDLPKQPKALLAPHAGYIYSGPIAASAFNAIKPWAKIYQRVILLGASHRLAFEGVAIPDNSHFTTPLGSIELDQEWMQQLLEQQLVVINVNAHSPEHALEVELPFLQTILPSFKLLPLLAGQTTPENIAAILRFVWGGPETLIVISSDLSHYLPYTEACRHDQATLANILALEPHLKPETACGALPLAGLILLAREKRLHPTLIDYRNSGDTAGDRNRVVGYAAMTFGAAHDPV